MPSIWRFWAPWSQVHLFGLLFTSSFLFFNSVEVCVFLFPVFSLLAVSVLNATPVASIGGRVSKWRAYCHKQLPFVLCLAVGLTLSNWSMFGGILSLFPCLLIAQIILLLHLAWLRLCRVLCVVSGKLQPEHRSESEEPHGHDCDETAADSGSSTRHLVAGSEQRCANAKRLKWLPSALRWTCIFAYPCIVTGFSCTLGFSRLSSSFSNPTYGLCTMNAFSQLASILGVDSLFFVVLWFALTVFALIRCHYPSVINSTDKCDEQRYYRLPIAPMCAGDERAPEMNFATESVESPLASTVTVSGPHDDAKLRAVNQTGDGQHDAVTATLTSTADTSIEDGKHQSSARGNADNSMDDIDNWAALQWLFERRIVRRNAWLFAACFVAIYFFGGVRTSTSFRNFYQLNAKYWQGSGRLINAVCVTRDGYNSGNLRRTLSGVSPPQSVLDVDLVVTSEEYATRQNSRDSDYLLAVSRQISVTHEHNVVAVLGFNKDNRIKVYNSIDNETEHLWTYYKGNPVPFQEHFKYRRMKPKKRKIKLTSISKRVSVGAEICYDAGFSDFTTLSGIRQSDVVIHPSYLWGANPEYLTRTFMFAAIQNGNTWFSCQHNGYALVANAYGETVYKTLTTGRHNKRIPVTTFAVPRRVWTFYAAIGWLYNYLMCALCWILIATAIVPKKMLQTWL